MSEYFPYDPGSALKPEEIMAVAPPKVLTTRRSEIQGEIVQILEEYIAMVRDGKADSLAVVANVVGTTRTQFAVHGFNRLELLGALRLVEAQLARELLDP